MQGCRSPRRRLDESLALSSPQLSRRCAVRAVHAVSLEDHTDDAPVSPSFLHTHGDQTSRAAAAHDRAGEARVSLGSVIHRARAHIAFYDMPAAGFRPGQVTLHN